MEDCERTLYGSITGDVKYGWAFSGERDTTTNNILGNMNLPPMFPVLDLYPSVEKKHGAICDLLEHHRVCGVPFAGTFLSIALNGINTRTQTRSKNI